MKKNDFIHSDLPQPHPERTRAIMRAHPEVQKLFGYKPSTAFYIFGVVALQIVVAIALRQANPWLMLLVAYTIGATANHALFVLIHDCTHNLVFRKTNPNRLAGIFCNLPIVFPSAIGFRNYHLLHHQYQGDLAWDADLAGPGEARVVGRDPIRKSLWLLFFFVFEGIVRPARVGKVKLMEPWTLFNAFVEFSFLAALTYFAGWGALIYLSLSTLFSIGLHPFGARWIQEHYVVHPGQETYSYYGPLNAVTFNVGHHNEHHDFMAVPWSRLPEIRKMAPEFYDTLYYHTSWTRLLFRFIFDPNLSLYSRVVRTAAAKRAKAAPVKVRTEPGLVT